jgi:hypothetical protein
MGAARPSTVGTLTRSRLLYLDVAAHVMQLHSHYDCAGRTESRQDGCRFASVCLRRSTGRIGGNVGWGPSAWLFIGNRQDMKLFREPQFSWRL